MKPVNCKSLFHFVCDQMDKLDKKEITVNEAAAQSQLAKQANNLLVYETKRVEVLMKLEVHNAIYKNGIHLREIEGKNFDE